MPTPRENAVNFATIWNLERPYSVHVFTREENEFNKRFLKDTEGILFPPDIEGRETRLYGGASGDFERRRTGEYAQRVVERLRTVLTDAHVTEQCKQFLIGYLADTSIPIGIPASLTYPLEIFGITFDAERYGIFDPNADLRQIEAELLSYVDTELGRCENKFIKEWHEAYNQRYGQ